MTGRALILLFAIGAAAAGAAGDGKPAAKAPNNPAAKPAPAAVPAAAVKAAHAGRPDTKCEACHTEDGWLPARFNHDRTGFALKGAHASADCARCHGTDFMRAIPTTCSGCHQDPHGQVFGVMCQGCHREQTWRTEMDVTAHLWTNFPLTGRHGALACTECHQDRRDRGYRQPTVQCTDCHQNDYLRTPVYSIDHVASRLSTDCRRCHQPTSFRPATLLQHEPCYPILQGSHRGVTCRECHNSLVGTRVDHTCSTRNQTCKDCHAHQCDISNAQHQDVAGYECESLKCAGCHARNR